MQKQVNVEMQVQVHVQVPGKDKAYSFSASLCSRIYRDLMKNTSNILKLPKYTFNNSETNYSQVASPLPHGLPFSAPSSEWPTASSFHHLDTASLPSKGGNHAELWGTWIQDSKRKPPPKQKKSAISASLGRKPQIRSKKIVKFFQQMFPCHTEVY